MLILPGDTTTSVDDRDTADLAALAAAHGLDEVRVVPAVGFWAGVYIDGPVPDAARRVAAGRVVRLSYPPAALAARSRVSMPSARPWIWVARARGRAW